MFPVVSKIWLLDMNRFIILVLYHSDRLVRSSKMELPERIESQYVTFCIGPSPASL